MNNYKNRERKNRENVQTIELPSPILSMIYKNKNKIFLKEFFFFNSENSKYMISYLFDARKRQKRAEEWNSLEEIDYDWQESAKKTKN